MENNTEIPWTLFLSSDRRMTRNLTRDIISRKPVSSPTVEEISWSSYLSGKCTNFVDICAKYPVGTFIGSNRQMVRKVTTQITHNNRKK